MEMDFAPFDRNSEQSKSKKISFVKNNIPMTIKMLQKIEMNDNKKKLDGM